MRGLFSQVGLAKERGRGLSPPLRKPDADAADAMGCFASPKRKGHHGSISDVCVLAYEQTNGLMAVASRGGMIKVFGGPGVELVLEEEGASVAGEGPPSHLLFPTPDILVGVTGTGAVLSWDLTAGGRGASIPSQLNLATGLEERVTSVHCCEAAPAAPAATGAASDNARERERYVLTGFESGRVRVAQVYPVCRASGYTVEPLDTSGGAPEELLSHPGDDEDNNSARSLGAVTAIASYEDRDGRGFGIFGHGHGGIVIWDWVRRKRAGFRGLTPPTPEEIEGCRPGFEDAKDREVTSLACHPAGKVFAAGFASGCYAVFSVSPSSHDASPPRWVHEVGDDGSCPREGPTIVRTAVSLVQWVGVRGAGAERGWGLVVAGGVEMEEGEEPDGVSLLVPQAGSGGSGSKARKKEIVEAAMAELETAVFVPFAMGQERLSHVHCVVSGATGKGGTGAAESTPSGEEMYAEERCDYGPAQKDAKLEQDGAVGEELIVLGLVKWNEELQGNDRRLHFRLASSIQACPIQTSPYVALLQLAPEKFGPHVAGFETITAMALTPLLSSSVILDFMACLRDKRAAEGKVRSPGGLARLLRGGHLRWPGSVPAGERNDALCTSELLVAGHSDGSLSFWECYGPASRQDAVSIADGRVVMREVPSGAMLLGSLFVDELAGGDGQSVIDATAVTALDVWIERDHIAAVDRNACWISVGFDSGYATVIVLSNRMEAGSTKDFGDGGGGGGGGGGGWEAESGGGTPLAEKPVEISDVKLGDGEAADDFLGRSDGGGGLLQRFVKRRVCERPSPRAEEMNALEDAELEAAIAEARAEARAIAASKEPRGENSKEDESVEAAEADQEGEECWGQPESDHLRQELSEAMAEKGGTWGDSRMPPSPSRPPANNASEEESGRRNESGAGGDEGGGGELREQRLGLDIPPKASLVQLSLRLHSLPVRCVLLSFDTRATALALVVADAGGVVSVTDVSTGSASLLPMRVPQHQPCRPSIAIGPLPAALASGVAQDLGASVALFVLLEGWLNVFDFVSRDPVGFVEVPGLTSPSASGDVGGGGTGGGGSDDAFSRPGGRTDRRDQGEGTPWLTCIDNSGLPLLPYASEPLSLSLSPPTAAGKSGGDGGGNTGGRRSGVELLRHTTWVSPPPSRTVLDDYHKHELQILTDSPRAEPLLLIVSGAVAVVLKAVQESSSENASSMFSWRGHPSPDIAAAFKGRSGAELVVQSRAVLPRAEGHASWPTVEGTGVCLVPVGQGPGGEAACRGCLVAVDSSGFATALLLPSLCPVFSDRLPAGGDVAGPRRKASMMQKSVCNLAGEVTLQGLAGELMQWSLLTDEACGELMGSKPRLVKVSALATRQSLSGGGSGGGIASSSRSSRSSSGIAGAATGTPPTKGRPARGMLRRLSLGGPKKGVADVFAAEPSPSQQSLARDSSGGSTRSSFRSSGSTRRGLGRGEGGGESGAGSAGEQATDQRKALFGEREAQDGPGAARGGGSGARGAGDVSGTHAAVSEARDLAIERGEKLENLVDRSRQLEDSAMAFGDMAKQLRRQQEDEACCLS